MPDTAPSFVARSWNKLGSSAAGRWLFSRLVCFRAPYFASISPRMQNLEPGYARATLRKRRRVQNHLGTVHALAMGNLCEFAAGLLLEVSIDAQQRWIPRGMNIEYLKKATTDVAASARVDLAVVQAGGDCPVQVDVVDTRGEVVVRATITMYVSDRPPKQGA